MLDALKEGDNITCKKDRIRYGLSSDDISKRIKACKPDLVGISNPYSTQIDNAINVADITKQIDPDIITVLGGAHPTAAGLDLMNKPPLIF